jgi:hypothetical protein
VSIVTGCCNGLGDRFLSPAHKGQLYGKPTLRPVFSKGLSIAQSKVGLSKGGKSDYSLKATWQENALAVEANVEDVAVFWFKSFEGFLRKF